MSQRHHIQALLWVTGSAFLFTFMFVLPKLTSETVPPMQVAFLRYFAGFIMISPIFLYSIRNGAADAPADTMNKSPSRAKIYRLHVLRAFFGATSVVCGAYAVAHIPLANAQAIAMTNGVFTVIFAVLFLRERIGLSEALAGIICLAGAVVVADPRFDQAETWISLGALAALLQAACWGGEIVLLRVTAVRDSAARILAIVNGSACLMLVLFVSFWSPDIAAGDIVILLLMGPVAIIGQFCNIRAYRLAQASTLAPYKYIGIIFSAGFGIVIFDEWPSTTTIIGAAMIIGGALSLLRAKRVPVPV